MFELGKGHFVEDKDSPDVQVAKWARVLVQVGLFEEAIRQLSNACLKVESTALALCLKELGLLKTRAYLLDCIRLTQTLGTLHDYKDTSDLVDLYDTCIEVDGMLISLSDNFNPRDHFSEAICTLYLIDDKNLFALSMAAYIQNNNLFHILIEQGDCSL